MDVRTALVRMRDELNMRQTDLATALGVTYVTVNRWETERSVPSRAMSLAIVAFASAHGVSKVCQAALKEALITPSKNDGIDSLKNADVAQINSLVNNSSNAVMVCDAKTHELLYINRQAGKITGRPVEQARGQKCYQYFLHRGTPCEDCPLENDDADEFFTMEYESPVTGRYYMRRSKMLTWSGKKAHLEYITDISELRKTSKALERSQSLATLACREAGIWMFSLDIADGTAHIEPIVQKSLHLPATVPNFIDYLAAHHVSSEESIAELQQTIPKLKQGITPVEVTMQTNFASEKTHWVRFRATTAEYDEHGKPVTAICSAQQIDNEKALQARIQFEHERILESRHDLAGYTISNLTQNTVVEHHRALDLRTELAAGITYDEAVRAALDSVEPERDKLRYLETHSREKLLANFRNGILGDTLEFQLMQPEKGAIWVDDTLKLMLQPVTGDVMLYEYCFLAHSKIIMEGLLSGATQNEYEQLGAISMIDGQMARVIFADSVRTHRLEFVPYENNQRAYCTLSIAPEMQDKFMEMTGLSTVKEKLKSCKTYRVTFQAAENGIPSTKLAQYTWHDETRQFCLFSLMDLTKFMKTLEPVKAPDAEV